MNSLPYASVWNLGLPATPADMSPENVDYGLNDMVRAGYLAKLRETLMVNIRENTASDRGSAEDGTIEMFVEKCLGEMEKEAIRKCMVAEIYCDAMRKTVREYLLCDSQNSPLGCTLKRKRNLPLLLAVAVPTKYLTLIH
ncbi:uncharacterized protein LOC112688437 [Sipha flava]|uniref:Uncharacterized protein LOC112688437 n=1 Tax=Sipha flava TaxID=143950 RepID=A0A2S2R356_9HEMI|nr:uncharacterized protein LOC112688437 [Sipha flava]